MQITLPPDAAGFAGFKCPSRYRYFKVLDMTFTAPTHVHCTYCGHDNESEKFLAAAEVGYLKRVGAGKVVEQLHGQFEDMLVNTFRNSKNMKVTREPHSPPTAPTRPNERTLPQQNTCPKCALGYAFDNDARVYPQCSDLVA